MCMLIKWGSLTWTMRDVALLGYKRSVAHTGSRVPPAALVLHLLGAVMLSLECSATCNCLIMSYKQRGQTNAKEELYLSSGWPCMVVNHLLGDPAWRQTICVGS